MTVEMNTLDRRNFDQSYGHHLDYAQLSSTTYPNVQKIQDATTLSCSRPEEDIVNIPVKYLKVGFQTTTTIHLDDEWVSVNIDIAMMYIYGNVAIEMQVYQFILNKIRENSERAYITLNDVNITQVTIFDYVVPDGETLPHYEDCYISLVLYQGLEEMSHDIMIKQRNSDVVINLQYGYKGNFYLFATFNRPNYELLLTQCLLKH